MDTYEAPHYPAINFLVRYGKPLALAIGASPLVASVAAVAAGLPWWLLLVGVLATPVLSLLVLSYVEMAKVISETLIPR